MENNNIHWKRKDLSKEFDSLEIPYSAGITASIIHWKYFRRFWLAQISPANSLFTVVYCFVCHKMYKARTKSNYLNSHGEEAQEKPPGL